MANADPLELDKFSQLAHRWWDPNSEFKPLHDINPLRLEWIDQAVGLAGKTILDVGCGGGLLSEGMAGYGAKVTGIDLSEKPLGVARLHLLESGRQVDEDVGCKGGKLGLAHVVEVALAVLDAGREFDRPGFEVANQHDGAEGEQAGNDFAADDSGAATDEDAFIVHDRI